MQCRLQGNHDTPSLIIICSGRIINDNLRWVGFESGLWWHRKFIGRRRRRFRLGFNWSFGRFNWSFGRVNWSFGRVNWSLSRIRGVHWSFGGVNWSFGWVNWRFRWVNWSFGRFIFFHGTSGGTVGGTVGRSSGWKRGWRRSGIGRSWGRGDRGSGAQCKGYLVARRNDTRFCEAGGTFNGSNVDSRDRIDTSNLTSLREFCGPGHGSGTCAGNDTGCASSKTIAQNHGVDIFVKFSEYGIMGRGRAGTIILKSGSKEINTTFFMITVLCGNAVSVGSGTDKH